MEFFELEKITKHLLEPQPKLASWIFDANNKMHENIRQGLLKIANKVIDETIANIKGLEVYDIVLTGSLPTYFYYDNSDVDIRILVRNKNCDDITRDADSLDAFLTIQKNILQARGYAFRYLDMTVDVKITSFPIEFVGLYSLIKNKFRVRPNKKIGANLITDDIMFAYDCQKNIIQKKIKRNDVRFEKVLALDDLYHQLYQSSYTGKIYKNYLIFKLLSKDGVLSQIQQSYVSCINQIFAFPSKQKISILTRIKRLFCIRKAICHDKL